MSEKLKITIDGTEILADQGQTILDVARENGIFIPTLCHLQGTTNVGACRVCVVEVVNARGLVASCAMPVSNGMVVKTDTPKVKAAQKMVVELLWSSGDHNCLTCEKNGDCTLQDLVYWLGIDKPRFEVTSPNYPLDNTNSMITRDLNKCILCGRCIRACNEIQVNEVLDFAKRGSKAKVGPAFDADYIDSDCYFCGECADACPTGAITFKHARFAGRPWEMKKVNTTCTYCGVGCQLTMHVNQGKVVKISGNNIRRQPNFGSLCVKGRFGFEFIHNENRLKTPLIRKKKGGELVEASWSEAYDFIAQKMKTIVAKNGADAVAGLASARCTNEENYLFQKFIRAGVGTNNVDHCARL